MKQGNTADGSETIGDAGTRLAGAFSAFLRRRCPSHKSHDHGDAEHLNLRTVVLLDLILVARDSIEPADRQASLLLHGVLVPVFRSLCDAPSHAVATAQLLAQLDCDMSDIDPGQSLLFLKWRGLLKTPEFQECAELFCDLVNTLIALSEDFSEGLRIVVIKMRFLRIIESEAPAESTERQEAREFLGLAASFSADELTAAYRQKVREWHPDRLEGMAPELKDLAEQRIKDINHAHSVLKGDLSTTGQTLLQVPGASSLSADHKNDARSSFDSAESSAVRQATWQLGDTETANHDGSGGRFVLYAAVFGVLVVAVLLVALLAGGFRQNGDGSSASLPSVVTPTQATTSEQEPDESVISHHPHAAKVGIVVSSTSGAAEMSSASEPEVIAAINSWADDMTTNDADQMASHYTEQVERYFLATNVSRQAVRDSMAEWLSQGHQTSRFSVSDLLVSLQGDGQASAQLIKNAVLVTPNGEVTVTTKSRLILRLVDGRWQIASNRDFN